MHFQLVLQRFPGRAECLIHAFEGVLDYRGQLVQSAVIRFAQVRAVDIRLCKADDTNELPLALRLLFSFMLRSTFAQMVPAAISHIEAGEGRRLPAG